MPWAQIVKPKPRMAREDMLRFVAAVTRGRYVRKGIFYEARGYRCVLCEKGFPDNRAHDYREIGSPGFSGLLICDGCYGEVKKLCSE